VQQNKMVVLITGASHTGKTLLAQKLLEKYKYSVLSIDLLKMGLIRSKNTDLTPKDDEELGFYLWKIVKEIVKTAIENKQNFNDIKQYANVIEQRIDDTWCTKESVLRDNMRSLELCRKYGCNYIFIDKCYEVEVEL
jgi:adenylate kinase family enzyme